MKIIMEVVVYRIAENIEFCIYLLESYAKRYKNGNLFNTQV
jgi:hypothetical protein